MKNIDCYIELCLTLQLGIQSNCCLVRCWRSRIYVNHQDSEHANRVSVSRFIPKLYFLTPTSSSNAIFDCLQLRSILFCEAIVSFKLLLCYLYEPFKLRLRIPKAVLSEV